jgi:hypothetical protein
MALVVLESLPAPRPWEAYRLPVGGFPAAEEETGELRRFWTGLSAAAAQTWTLNATVFLQFAQLHTGDVWKRVSEHGAAWLPEIGLGVWPDRPAPHLWTEQEFLDLVPGSSPVLMYQLFRISGPGRAKEQAREVMLGHGTVLEVLSAEPSDGFLSKGREVFLPGIEDPIFRMYPFYAPLLEAGTVGKATAEDLGRWSCGAWLYIRESTEDRAILITSREPLGPVLQKMGGRTRSGGAGWEIPC